MTIDIATLLLKSVGAGYGALNIACRDTKIEVLEFAPLGTRSHLIIKGAAVDLNDYIVRLRTSDIERTMVIDQLPEGILRNYLSLDFSGLKKFMLVYEANFVGDLFQKAKMFSNMDLAIVDFRVQRMENSPGYLLLTGDDPEKIKETSQQLKRSGEKLTFIPNLSEQMKQYFD